MDIRYMNKIANQRLINDLFDLSIQGDYQGNSIWRAYIKMLNENPELLPLLYPLYTDLINERIGVKIYGADHDRVDRVIVQDLVDLAETAYEQDTRPKVHIVFTRISEYPRTNSEQRHQTILKKLDSQTKRLTHTDLIDLTALAEETLFKEEFAISFFNPKSKTMIIFVDLPYNTDTTHILEPFNIKLSTILFKLTKILYLVQFVIVPQIKQCTPEEEALINHIFQGLCDQDPTKIFKTIQTATDQFTELHGYKNPLITLSQSLNEVRVNQLRTQLLEAQERYETRYDELLEKAQRITRLKKALGQTVFTDIDYETIIPIVEKNPNLLILLDVTEKNQPLQQQIYAHFTGEIKVDPDLVKPHLLQNKEALLLFQELIKGNIAIPVFQPIRITINNELAHFTSTQNLFPELHEPSILNPHISGYNCLGSYDHEINQALLSNNWAMVIELLAKSIQELNLADYTVVRSFISNYLGEPANQHLPIKDLRKNMLTTWKQYYKEYTDNHE